MCVCVCVCVQFPAVRFCICSISIVSYMCAKIRVWSCLVTDNFGLFTEIAVCKFLRGMARNLFYFVYCMCFIHFSAAFCTAHCALDLARDHAP